MRTIVTGGAGFVGSHLVQALLGEGAEVHVIDSSVDGRLDLVPRGAKLYNLDIRAEEAKAFIIRLRPDIIFHQASQGDVERSVRQPDYDAGADIAGTVNLLEASRLAKVRKFIYASSCAVYGDQPVDIIEEDTPQHPVSYYGLSKLTCEWYIELFHQLYGLSYTILRYGNVYGSVNSGNDEGGVVTKYLQCLAEGKPLTVYGDGEQSRDFVYVKDVVSANLAAVYKGGQQTIQIGTGTSTTILELIQLLKEIVYEKKIRTEYGPARRGEIRFSRLSTRKAEQVLNWKPLYALRQGLSETYLSMQIKNR